MHSTTQFKLRGGMMAVLLAALSSPVALADSHGHMEGGHGQGEHMMDSSQMHHDMDEEHGSMMREVMGQGVVNKVRTEHHMLNITHEPIPEMNWPKMRMNFETDPKVDLSKVKPGQTVKFHMQVDQDNNYLIKDVEVVE